MANNGRKNRPGSGARNKGGTPYQNPVLQPGETMQQRQRRLLNDAKEDQQRIRDEIEQERQASQIGVNLSPLPGPKSNVTSGNVRRYPGGGSGGGINSESDYVLFEFFKYSPPFRKQVGARPDQQPGQRTNTGASAGNYFNYNGQYDPVGGEDYKPIIMYMPEDVSTGFKSNWGGKAFSNIAADALRSAGAEGLSKLDNFVTGTANAFERLPAIAGSMAIRKGIQKITGDSLSNDDIFGSISGSILNPNVELLFQSTDMRNFQLNFKLVPRNSGEVEDINNIIKTFKMCTLPQRNPGKVFGASSQGITAGFIGVPNLCRVSFMKGSGVHPVLPIYKMCAITQVDVNYTPDGVYATYDGGQPVAIQLGLNFQETKLVFADEVQNNTIR